MSRSLYDKLYRRFGATLSDSEISARSKRLIDAERSVWSAFLVSPGCKSRLKKTRVAIVGGGFAGMMAAWSLCEKEKEIEVVVFEASDEVGGRVRSNKNFTKGRIIEFGAELIGANHPVWLGLAQELGVGLMTRTGEDHFTLQNLEMKLRIDGKDFTTDEGKKLTANMKIIFKEIGRDAKKINNPRQPWSDPKLQPLDNMSVLHKLAQLTMDKLTFRAIQLLFENDFVTSLDKMNYLGLLCLVKAGQFPDDKDDPDFLGFWEQTETFRCTDGCQALVTKMAAKLSGKEYKFTLLTRTPVRAIETDSTNARPVKLKWDTSDAVRRWKNPNPNFDYVILATAPSVWADIPITPEHPKDKFSPQMGPAVKFFSNLKNRFWIGEGAAPSGMSSDLGMIWEGTDNQTQVGQQEIELSVFAGGPAITGRVLMESDFKKELGKLYRGYHLSSTGITKLVNWSDKKEFKYIQTGYSYPRPKHIFAIAPQLQSPLNQGRLFLAGEYTETDFFGFMEGALRSGQRAAKAVIAKVCPETLADFPNA